MIPTKIMGVEGSFPKHFDKASDLIRREIQWYGNSPPIAFTGYEKCQTLMAI